jgi:hypothetical protein
MISAREMLFKLEEVSCDLPEGFDVAALSAVISKANPIVISKFIKEVIISSSDALYDFLKKMNPSLDADYVVFKKLVLNGVKGLDPRVIYKETKEASRKYGWQLGTIFAVKNILTTFIIPPIFLAFGLKGAAAFVALFPSNVVFVPLLIKYFSVKAQAALP